MEQTIKAFNQYSNGDIIQIGDVFTDGHDDSRSNERLRNKAKVLYADKWNLIWFPLNDFTTHTYAGKLHALNY